LGKYTLRYRVKFKPWAGGLNHFMDMYRYSGDWIEEVLSRSEIILRHYLPNKWRGMRHFHKQIEPRWRQFGAEEVELLGLDEATPFDREYARNGFVGEIPVTRYTKIWIEKEHEKMKANIGVIGYGVVGKAIAKGFSMKGHTLYVDDVRNLQGVNSDKKEISRKAEYIFLCVNTPSKPNGECDLTNLSVAFREVVKEINKACWAGARNSYPLLVVKSTVPPGTTDKLAREYPFIASNPEFLRNKNALEDFLNPSRIVIGARKHKVREDLVRLYDAWDAPNLVYNSPTTAELIKHLSNAFLVSKVAYSEIINEVTNLYMDVEPMDVYNGITLDPRINESHLAPRGPIPEDDHCLPKDLSALIRELEKHQCTQKLLKEIYLKGIKNNEENICSKTT